ncbi:dodecin domain-containing protein [Nitrincola alkalilacustris]|uniref:dodecin domain-containing protein n=1 Tax=Nitrincola alkalilacustris TaxID=1571224 RepID=UPI00124C303A|nr:dodecin domain-containing protein [Nitrincola alkalilacustris]
MPARIYKIIEVAGSSTVGTDDAIRCAIAKAVKIEWGVTCHPVAASEMRLMDLYATPVCLSACIG